MENKLLLSAVLGIFLGVACHCFLLSIFEPKQFFEEIARAEDLVRAPSIVWPIIFIGQLLVFMLFGFFADLIREKWLHRASDEILFFFSGTLIGNGIAAIMSCAYFTASLSKGGLATTLAGFAFLWGKYIGQRKRSTQSENVG